MEALSNYNRLLERETAQKIQVYLLLSSVQSWISAVPGWEYKTHELNSRQDVETFLLLCKLSNSSVSAETSRTAILLWATVSYLDVGTNIFQQEKIYIFLASKQQSDPELNFPEMG